MKKHLTSRIAMFLALCMLILSSIAAVPVGAENVVSSDVPDEHFIVHYDFEGDTEAEKLKDKAPNHGSANDLKKYGEVTVENGIATMNGGKSNYLQANGKGTDDFKDKTAYTVVIRFRASGECDGWTNLFKLTYLSRCYFSSGTLMNFRNGNCKATQFQLNYNGGWQTLAVTVNFSDNSADGWYPGCESKNGTFSVDSGKDPYTQTQINLGNQGATVDSSLTFEIDDFRIYDTVLSEAQVNQIHLSLCSETVPPVTASDKTLAEAAVRKELMIVLNCTSDALSLTDTVFTAGESLVATVHYQMGEKSVVLKNFPFAVNAPKSAFVGHQVSSALSDRNTFSIRFIGSVAALSYEGAGLEVTSAAKGTVWTTQKTGVVYSALLGKTDDSGIIRYQAPEGTYYTAYTIENIPADAADTFTVRTFVIENGVRIWGDTFVLTFNGYGELNVAE